MIEQLNKTCTGCGRTLPLSEFYRENTTRAKYHRASRCKRCRNETHTAYVATHEILHHPPRVYEAVDEKVCTHCGQLKPKSAFGFHKWQKKQLRSWCKTCEAGSRSEQDYPISVTEKECNKCGEIKRADKFGRRRASRDGLFSSCLECEREDRREQYRAHPGRQREADKRWKVRHLEAARLYARLAQAIRRSASRATDLTKDDLLELLKGPCAKCGTYDDLTMAHDLAVSKGGLTIKANVFCLCQKHNSEMGTMRKDDFLLSTVDSM